MDLQRDRSITLTQSYLINEETKVAVIPIMRNASSMLEYVLQQHNFTITKERRTDNSWTYYTVWRNPYERLISVLQRELCGVYDNNLHRVHAAIDEQMIQCVEFGLLIAWLIKPSAGQFFCCDFRENLQSHSRPTQIVICAENDHNSQLVGKMRLASLQTCSCLPLN